MLVTVNPDPGMIGLALFGTYGENAPYVAGVDPTGKVAAAYEVTKFPTVIILDRQQRVRYIGHQRQFENGLGDMTIEIDRILETLLAK